MIRATVSNGDIELIDPLPEDWENGRELFIEAAEPAEANDDLDAWLAEMNELAAKIDPEDVKRFERGLAEADAQAKHHVRRQMGLPE